MNSFLTIAFLHLVGSAISTPVEERCSSTVEKSTLAGRVIQRMLAGMEASGVNITLSQVAAAEVIEELDSLATFFSREQTSVEQNFCWSEEDFDLAALVREVQQTYTRSPFSCVRSHQSRTLHREHLPKPVFQLFNESALTTDESLSSTASLVAHCMFQDFTERFGGSGLWSDDRFDDWNEASLQKFPGLQRLATEQIANAVSLTSLPMSDTAEGLYWMLRSASITLTRAYPLAETDAERYFIYQKLKKMYMVFFLPSMFADADAGKEDMPEALFMARVCFYGNVQWAVNMERMALSQGAPGADAENVALGERLLKVYKSCLFFRFSRMPPQWRLATGGSVVQKSTLLYMLWNHRFVHLFKGADYMKAVCERLGSQEWKLAPWAMLHAVVALGTVLNRNGPDFSDWWNYRVVALAITEWGSQQDCDGNVGWLARDP